MNINWFGRLMPYWLVEKMCKEFGQTGAMIKVGNREFSVNLLFANGEEAGFGIALKVN